MLRPKAVPMRRLLPRLVLAFVPTASLAHADGCPASECGTTSVAPPGSSLVFVRPSGRQGPLQAYDLRTGVRRFALPSGMLAADGRSYAAAVRVKGGTRIMRFDTRNGRAGALRTLPGSWHVR